MDQFTDATPRTYIIRRSTHLGYGFVAGSEGPTLVKAVEPNGPSARKLQQGDEILAVNGINVENATKEQIITMISKSPDEIEIKVRKASYENMIRAYNMTDSRFYQLQQQQQEQQLSRSTNNHNNLIKGSNSSVNSLSTSRLPHNNNNNNISPFGANTHNLANQSQPNLTNQNGFTNNLNQSDTTRFPHMDRLVTSISHQKQQQHLQHNDNHLNGYSPSSMSTVAPIKMSSAVSQASIASRTSTNMTSATPASSMKDDNETPRPILRQQQQFNNDSNFNGRVDPKDICITTRTLGRPPRQPATSYGRHSPVHQRCKSSIDGTQTLKPSGKKSGDNENDQPMLKRSNTMRPIRPPAKVLEIFEVVIKIFFEDGTTRVLNYNRDTTVATILETLNTRLIEKGPHSDEISGYFGLVLTVEQECPRGSELKPKPHYVLNENDSIMKIGQLPYREKLRFLYRMVYPPNDVNALYTQNKVAFEYLYKQSINDLKMERFNPKLDHESALKLVAFTIIEYVYSNCPKQHGNSKNPKVFMKLIKKSPGIEYFLPRSMLDDAVDKKGKKLVSPQKKYRNRLTEQLRQNFDEFDLDPPKARSLTNLERYSTTSFHELSLPELNSSPVDYIKLVFLNCLTQLPCYGSGERPIRKSPSPVEATSGTGDFSSSLESFPRTSDSSPLIRQDQAQQPNGYSQHTIANRAQLVETNNIARLAHMNNMRPVINSQTGHINNIISQSTDRPDTVTTPSIESLSSITFNMQGSPSPPQTASLISVQPGDSYHTGSLASEPSPLPRHNQANPPSKLLDNWALPMINSSNRPIIDHRSIEESIRSYSIPPPPPTNQWNFDHLMSQHTNMSFIQNKAYLTQILTDQDLERLKVPPPPRAIYQP